MFLFCVLLIYLDAMEKIFRNADSRISIQELLRHDYVANAPTSLRDNAELIKIRERNEAQLLERRKQVQMERIRDEEMKRQREIERYQQQQHVQHQHYYVYEPQQQQYEYEYPKGYHCVRGRRGSGGK